jgi:hypothetical protein
MVTGGVVMVAVMMVPRGAKGRGGEDHQQQGCGKILFHASNVARRGVRRKSQKQHAPREERVNASVQALCPWLLSKIDFSVN